MVRRADAIARAQPLLEREATVRWAYLFGSCARGEEGRDVDLAVMLRAGARGTAVAWGQWIAALELAVEAEVDLVDLRLAPLSLIAAVLGQRILLVDREPAARHAWEAQELSRWLDFKPALERYERVRRAAMERRLRGTS